MEKSVLKSKTFWLQVIAVLGMLFPPVQAWMAGNEHIFLQVWAGLNILLRFVTKDKIVLVESVAK